MAVILTTEIQTEGFDTEVSLNGDDQEIAKIFLKDLIDRVGISWLTIKKHQWPVTSSAH